MRAKPKSFAAAAAAPFVVVVAAAAGCFLCCVSVKKLCQFIFVRLEMLSLNSRILMSAPPDYISLLATAPGAA